MTSTLALSLPQISAQSERKGSNNYIDIQKNLTQVSNFNLILKGLNCVFGWAAYLPISSGASSQIGASRSIVKLCSSTMGIPKLANKSIQLYRDVKELICCVNSGGPRSECKDRILDSVSDVFFSSVAFLKRTSKVIFCLDKTQVIDLSLISEAVPEVLEKFCFATTLVFAIRRIAASVFRLHYLNSSGTTQLQQFKNEHSNEKDCLMLKIASSTLKLFSCALVTLAFFVPALAASPFLLLGVSSVSFGLGLTGAFIKPGRFDAPFNSSGIERPIYYLKA